MSAMKIFPEHAGHDRTREYALDRRMKEMISEAVAALGIEPTGDESARWAAVLEAIRQLRLGGLSAGDYRKLEAWSADPERRDPSAAFTAGAARDAANAVAGALANRAAVGWLGWTVVDRNGKPFIPLLEFHPKIHDRATAQIIADALNRHPHETQADRVPYGVVSVGPVAELKP